MNGRNVHGNCLSGRFGRMLDASLRMTLPYRQSPHYSPQWSVNIEMLDKEMAS
jgi:hypothetical protein